MFDEVSDITVKIKEAAMRAMLPDCLPTKMKEEFIQLSHKMTNEQIAEVGRRFREAHDKAWEEYNEKLKDKERNNELLAQRMSSRQ